ncbi:MAG: hypothetical protein ABEJ43_06260 [Haloferacaceae archaeon]
MSDETNSGDGPRGGDGTRATVEDLRGGVEQTAPPTGVEREDTVDADESALLAALLSAVIPGAGHVNAGLRRRGMYSFGAWLVYLFISSVFVLYGVGIVMLLALPLVHLVVAADAYRRVTYWRERERPRVG